MPLVALWGVENEAVVRDIAAACKGDYSYLHRTLNSLDGMDFALLYYGDLFEPHYDERGAATSTSRASSTAAANPCDGDPDASSVPRAPTP